MDIFEKHELFEIEVLEKLKNKNFLQPLVFGGGTMLRLCHDLPRYSVDLDFWFIKNLNLDEYFKSLMGFLKKFYEVTDAQIKHFSLLLEFRSPIYPKRLKIEIRKEIKKWDMEENIAFTKHGTIQVMLKTHTLQQTMKNKINALLNRNEIRDAYDIEFLLRRGIALPVLEASQKDNLIVRIEGFKPNDFKVKLGSILESTLRNYYIENGFRYLLNTIRGEK